MSFISMVGQSLTPKNVALGVMVCDMIGRPAITMTNKKIPIETRKTIAIREFLTELLGASLTYGVATTVEKFVPKMLAKKLYNVHLTEEVGKNIIETSFKTLSPVNQKIRGIMLLSSFVGTIIAASILTPLLNNFLTNKVMDKFLKSPGHGHGGGHGEVAAPAARNNSAIIQPAFSSSSQSTNFNRFLDYYQTANQGGKINSVA